jgi:hypothetical protein
MAIPNRARKAAHSLLAILAATVALAAAAQDAPKPAAPQAGLPTGAEPAPPGTVPWQLLQSTKTVQLADKKFGPSFPKEVKDLDKKQVKLYGFMMPLDQAKKQKRFLLSAFPPHCAFCLTGGPESLVEVMADQPIDFTFEPIVVGGRMAVLDNDVVYYRLTNASAVRN